MTQPDNSQPAADNCRDALLVLSGGMDSTTMLHEYAAQIALAVTFDYGSNHNAREAECARRQCELLGIEWLCIPLGFMGRYFKSSLLEGPDAIPEAEYDGDNIRSTVVPFRNGIMLAVAAGLAESRGLRRVMIANHAGDHEVYPDCRPEFIRGMSAAIAAGTFAPVILDAPYTLLTKGEIAAHGLRLGVDYDMTYSCYKGGATPCGVCATCREREAALAEAHRITGL
ncbi:MAG: 7-cyano-7-deazaguanine synthase QueC [Candidatus Amulumruptor caecigallinarius]|nr:7-cyano-7-deazaguanine synthase QueC [Candidatus Amulumruptor caecigallinarius]MCM1397188.1 7-cyano-7-deazaguanine synthase QueC [Candidatus Amulumruptor caecigallinarius]MCM1453123.1 7-cyano-7-deazaguanine synthase QueC [bacterium]